MASSRTNDGKRTVRRGFVIALVVVVLVAVSIGTGFAFSAFQLLVQTDATFRDHGYLAFCPDYRGSGKSEGKPELAKGEVDDVINGILYLKSKGLVDDNRVGLFGQSHGASVAMIVAGRYPKVKAVVEAAGFTNLARAYEYHIKSLRDMRIKKLLMPYYSVIGRTPDQVPQEYAVRSAVNYVQSIQAPILIVHGAKDPIVPVSQAEEMYQALRKAGKTAQIKIYPNEGHGVSDRKAQVELWLLTFSWFEKYI